MKHQEKLRQGEKVFVAPHAGAWIETRHTDGT